MNTRQMTDTSPLGIFTTTRPLSNDDRKEIWEGRNDSPPVEQPQQLRFCVSVFRELLGWALVALICLGVLIYAAMVTQ